MSTGNTTTLTLWLRVENNSRFVRAKSKVREQIEREILLLYAMKPRAAAEYELTFSYTDEDDLNQQVLALLNEMEAAADLQHCFIETDMRDPTTDCFW